MCGLAGVMTRDGTAPAAAVLSALQNALAHRGPDGRGSSCAATPALVHLRLAIVDLATGDQPLYGPAGIALVANGEIYNDPDLRAAMAGHAVQDRLGLRTGGVPAMSATASASPTACAACTPSPSRTRRAGGWCWRAIRSVSSRSTT